MKGRGRLSRDNTVVGRGGLSIDKKITAFQDDAFVEGVENIWLDSQKGAGAQLNTKIGAAVPARAWIKSMKPSAHSKARAYGAGFGIADGV